MAASMPAIAPKMLVGGTWTDAIAGEAREILNPADGTRLAQVPEASGADVEQAVAAARSARDAWGEATPGERAAVLLRLGDALDEHAGELAAIESANAGKPLAAARDEIAASADALRFFAGAARTLEGRSAGEYLRGHTSMVRREPIGIVAGIVPWNYPLMMAAWKIGPALAAGNALILKPAEQTPLSLLRFLELAGDAIPAGVVNVVTGDGAGAGAPLVAHRVIGLVSLTGDVGTGRTIAREAAASLKRVHLELGGKAPVVVLRDADLDEVVGAVRVAGYWNAGQDCTAAARVIVEQPIHDALLERLVPAVASLRLGDPADGEHVELGPVISRVQQERVLGFVERAVAAGARVLTGGGAGPAGGCFVEPTILADVAQDAEIVQREVFGPVVTVQAARDADHALALANDTDYGLAASVFTRDVALAMDAARRLAFGTVWVNDHMPLAAEMPHGGFKQSGYGKDLSAYSLEDYTQIKHVAVKVTR